MTRTAPLSPEFVELAILEAVEDLERLTEEFAEISDAEALAENAYKRRKYTLLVTLANDKPADGTKALAQWKAEAKVEVAVADEADAYRLTQAVLRSKKEALLTKRARLDALRSLGASIRAQV